MKKEFEKIEDKINILHHKEVSDKKKTLELENELINIKKYMKNRCIPKSDVKKRKIDSLDPLDNSYHRVKSPLINFYEKSEEKSVQQRVSILELKNIEQEMDKEYNSFVPRKKRVSILDTKYCILEDSPIITKSRNNKRKSVQDRVSMLENKINRLRKVDFTHAKLVKINLNFLVKQKFKFNGAVHSKENIYFTPYCADVIGVLDTLENKFSTISLRNKVHGDYKFSGSVINDGNIYFAPYNANCIGLLNIDTAEFSIITIENTIKGFCKFR